jgi:hypothetical protein
LLAAVGTQNTPKVKILGWSPPDEQIKTGGVFRNVHESLQMHAIYDIFGRTQSVTELGGTGGGHGSPPIPKKKKN